MKSTTVTKFQTRWLPHAACTSTDVETPWNILYHVGGNGPWIQKKEGTVEEGIEPPRDCKVEQVHMVSESPRSEAFLSSGRENKH